MKVVEVNRILDRYSSITKKGKFIVRKKVSANKLIPSLRTITLELYQDNKKIFEISDTSKSTSDETDTSRLCEELMNQILQQITEL